MDRFTGRAAELAELDRLLAEGMARSAVVISAVSGTAGVGKTALALRWAHQIRDRFPDGQLYVNLRGYDPDQPALAGDALAGFLRALGVQGEHIPLDGDERAAKYRSVLDGRRVLVLLDNAATVEQVRPLLPGTGSCLVVVTSRDSLAGLVARDGAQRLDLDLLPLEDAVGLLRALIGERVDAEPEWAAALVEQCVRLPLALRVAAELAATRRTTSLAELVAELDDQRHRLNVMDAGGDPRTAVRSVFSWSYRYLPAEAARMFRLIGWHTGPDLDPFAAAALTDTSRDDAQHRLDLLVRTHMVQSVSGRYGMHDLLRAYAVDLATAEDSEEEIQVALTRLFDHYLATAAAAMNTLYPAEQHRRSEYVPEPETPIPPVDHPAVALAWLDTERGNLTAACTYAVTLGWPEYAIWLAATLWRYLQSGSFSDNAFTIHTVALNAARDRGDQVAEANALNNLGTSYLEDDRYDDAAGYYQQALDLWREINHPVGEADALGNLGSVYANQGRFDQAVDCEQRSLDVYRKIGDRFNESRILRNLAWTFESMSRYEQAFKYARQALSLSREVGNRTSEALVLCFLGRSHQRRDQLGQAAVRYQQALIIFREIGRRIMEFHVLDNLGSLYWQQGCRDDATGCYQQMLTFFQKIDDLDGEFYALIKLGGLNEDQGRYGQAAEHLQRALALSRELGHQDGEVQALNALGATYLAAGEPHNASIQHATALSLATEIGDRYSQACAHDGLARTHQVTGNSDQARHHWREALTLYTELGDPEADEVRTRLTALQSNDGSLPP